MFKSYEERYHKGYYKQYMRNTINNNRLSASPSPPSSPSSACIGSEIAVEHSSTAKSSAKDVIKAHVDTRSQHATGSVHQLNKYFTKELLDKVTAWVMPDLLEYHYPIWYSNMTAEEYLQQVYTFPYPSPALEEN